jgi:hypothetical protein
MLRDKMDAARTMMAAKEDDSDDSIDDEWD